MKRPSFSLSKNEVVLSDPEALADRLAEFLRAQVQPDASDRDLILMFVDRLFLGLCDDFSDDELMQGVQVRFEGLDQIRIASLRAMQARVHETNAAPEKKPTTQAAEAGA